MKYYINEKTITIKRQVFVGDKSSFSTVGTATGYLRNLTQDEASLNGFQWGKAFALLFEKGIDIKKSDKVTIDGVEYEVQDSAEFPTDKFAVPYQRALVTKAQKI